MKKSLYFSLVSLLGLLSCQKEKPKPVFTAVADYKKAESFLYRRNDSAFFYFNKVVAAKKDSLQVAMALNQMGVIQSEAGDFFGAQESLLASLNFLHKANPRDRNCLASDYNELGLTSFNLKDYRPAVAFFDSAAIYSDHKPLQSVILGNKALAYRDMGAYPQALVLYRKALSSTQKYSKDYARSLSNMALTKWLADPGYRAAPELLLALGIRQRENDLWGLNASYVHLTRYYSAINRDSALYYALRWYAAAKRVNSPDDQLEALPALIKLSPKGKVKAYFTKYLQLADSIQRARNAAKNQFALIRYDAEKNKADKLELQKQNNEKRYQIVKQQIFLAGTLLVLFGGSALALFWFRKRKQRMELEAQNRINESRLQTSKKVHDVVANGLYRMMSEVENRQEVDRDALLDKIEVLYEKSRDISYESSRHDEQAFHDKIAEIIFSFATPGTEVILVGNDEDFWRDVKETSRYELEHILQELMVNMKKHSGAAAVVLKMETTGEGRKVLYSDDGVGLKNDFRPNNGLTNTGNRIRSIGGDINFDEHTGKGLRITLSFPVT
ncbi:ATP-binding protein [Mucilaginibacter lutimaris]|uniref:histidine kinase n=1 Tax=Mucilaginibacter lutimaris TaxID=931629 RepID=A0ABW2ZGI1_9SPHI